jgi:hypothetical protein
VGNSRKRRETITERVCSRMHESWELSRKCLISSLSFESLTTHTSALSSHTLPPSLPTHTPNTKLGERDDGDDDGEEEVVVLVWWRWRR